MEDKLNYTAWVMAPFACMLLYVLSMGPVALVMKKSGASGATARQLYAPVIWLHDNSILKKPIDTYLHFWGVS